MCVLYEHAVCVLIHLFEDWGLGVLTGTWVEICSVLSVSRVGSSHVNKVGDYNSLSVTKK